MEPFANIVRSEEAAKTYGCPCCQNRTLYGRAQDEICPVCFWHDDGQDDHDAEEVRGGPNKGLSLAQARQNYQRWGAVEERLVSHARRPLPEERA
jgi:hypothetical protein